MLYALRKLIAFVFLGGIFWFIYSDPAEIGSPVFMHALGVMTFLFAFFWLVIPEVVVRMRVRARKKQNEARFEAWKKNLNGQPAQPVPRRANKFALDEGEEVFLHEKGTLYAVPRMGFDEISAKGKPGDVAFPGVRRNTRKIQRTHCYLTDQRVLFLGKAVNFSISFPELQEVEPKPGGLVFTADKDGKSVPLAFTFQNPLVAAEVLRQLRNA